MYSKDINMPRLVAQLKILPALIQTYNKSNPLTRIKKVTNLRTWYEIMNGISSSKSMLREVFSLLRILLTIPVTTAKTERTFSCLGRLNENFPEVNHVTATSKVYYTSAHP